MKIELKTSDSNRGKAILAASYKEMLADIDARRANPPKSHKDMMKAFDKAGLHYDYMHISWSLDVADRAIDFYFPNVQVCLFIGSEVLINTLHWRSSQKTGVRFLTYPDKLNLETLKTEVINVVQAFSNRGPLCIDYKSAPRGAEIIF